MNFFMTGRKRNMIRGNFHTHTVFCDGKNTAQEMADQALALGFTHLGFSGHMDPDIRMDLAAYDSEIRRLQREYRGRLDILRGVELDLLYCPQSREEEELLAGMEYLIGSVHFLEADGKAAFAVDDTAEQLDAGCREYFGGDYYRMAKAYYEQETQIYDRMHCTFAGHFDLITRFNDDRHDLDESDRRYYMPALEAMEYLVSKGIPFELNSGAVNRGRKAELYPNRFFLRNLREMGGEILISSDAHQKELLAGGFAVASRTAIECGFTHTLFLEHTGDGSVCFRHVPLA